MVRLELTSEGGEARFGLLDTLREFAHEQLTAHELAVLRQRHAQYFVTFAARFADPEFASQHRWDDREVPDLLAALSWLEASEEGAEGAMVVWQGLWLLGTWNSVGRVAEARRHAALILQSGNTRVPSYAWLWARKPLRPPRPREA